MLNKLRFEDKVAIIEFSGSITVSDLRGMYARMLHSNEYRPEINALWDFSGCYLDIAMQEMADLANFVVVNSHRRSPDSFAAIVATGEHNLKLLDAYITYASKYPIEFRIFDSFDNAKDWLD